MTATWFLGRPRLARRHACLLAAALLLPFDALSAAPPILWSLKPTRSDPLTAWSIAAPPRSMVGIQPILPDPTGAAQLSSGDPSPQDFSIAPSVDNILNRRHDLSEDQSGGLGSSAGYLRSVGRTFGLALKKSLY